MTPTPPGTQRPKFLVSLLLVLASAFALYFPTRHFEFLNYDDDVYVTANPMLKEGFSPETLEQVFTTSRAANWHPLTWLSHLLDVQIFGLDPGAHHLVNAALHAINAALFLVLLVALGAPLGPALFGALFFALHPLRAESVAWVSERKDLLAGLFFLLTLLAHLGRVRASGRWSAYRRGVLVALALTLGLLAKPMLVTAPLVLLLLDLWPLRRPRSIASLLLEKLPLFALVGGSILLTLRAQSRGGAMDALGDISLGSRIANAFASIERYLETTLWPHDLALFYPHPAYLGDPIGPRAWVGLALLVGISLLAARLWRRFPALAIGWGWYLVTLVPVIGIVQVGLQSHADRYTLIPGMGLALLLAFGAGRLIVARPTWTKPVGVLGAVWILALASASRSQIATWHDSKSAMAHAVSVTEKNFLAETNLARALEDEGRPEEALPHYRLAAEYRPGVPLVHYQLGRSLALRGDLEGSTEQFRLALSGPPPRHGVSPEYGAARTALGINLSRLGEDREAAALLETSWNAEEKMTKDRAAAGQALAWVLATSSDETIRDGRRALEIVRLLLRYQRGPGLLETLAAASAEVGDWNAAIEAERQALELIPPSGKAGARARLELYRDRKPYRRSRAEADDG
ncbi:MAG TPA: hypothetical protein ENJ09_13305 [Planctomycetes bacterium]|nr:hypothetical protein [Planctomycetota bacterium]